MSTEKGSLIRERPQTEHSLKSVLPVKIWVTLF